MDSNAPKVPEALGVNIACGCHTTMQNPACPGAMNLLFPTRMFDAHGELEYRQSRIKAAMDFVALWDRYYEEARKQLAAVDPHTMRPVRAGRKFHIIELAEEVGAMVDEVTAETPEEGGEGDPGIQE